MTLPTIYATREEWLTQASNELRPAFEIAGAKLPDRIRLTCGLPSNALRSNAIGECWIDTVSADKHYEVFIHPKLASPREVFEVVVHELIHTAKGGFNHGVNFQRIASAMLLEPVDPFRKEAWGATCGTPDFDVAYGAIIDSLGAYPHGSMTIGRKKKKQSTRMLSAKCPSCGYAIRLSAKWASYGMPICPVDSDVLSLVDSE